MVTSRTFGALVRLEREYRGLSQREVGDWLGISDAAVNKWEHDLSTPAPETVFELERRFGVAPGHLSRALGYMPISEDELALDVLAAIEADRVLEQHEKNMLKAAYREALKRPRGI